MWRFETGASKNRALGRLSFTSSNTSKGRMARPRSASAASGSKEKASASFSAKEEAETELRRLQQQLAKEAEELCKTDWMYAQPRYGGL